MELLPCPDCGGEIYIWQSNGGAAKELPSYAASCKTCKKEWDFIGTNKREASKVWNEPGSVASDK